MDKFGIFNILNSLSEILSKTSNGVNEKTEKKTDTEEKPTIKEKNEKPVLKSALLNTMNSHDKFVKRVQEKEKFKP